MRALLIVVVVTGLVRAAHGDVALDVLRATVRVDGGGQSGTAFLVGLPARDGAAAVTLLVTAAHVFTNAKGDACTVSFRGVEPGGRCDARVPVRDGQRPLWIRHPDADVAVLPVAMPPDVDAAPFELSQVADGPAFARAEVAVGQTVWVACFPAKTEANAAGWPILRRGTIASHPLTPVEQVKTFFVDYAHFGGDSGSAAVVERGGEPLVAGVVVAMQRQTDRVTSPFEEKKVHTPLGLAITVPADRILRTIELWQENQRGRVAPDAD